LILSSGIPRSTAYLLIFNINKGKISDYSDIAEDSVKGSVGAGLKEVQLLTRNCKNLLLIVPVVTQSSVGPGLTVELLPQELV
jgi:hypothetical protein